MNVLEVIPLLILLFLIAVELGGGLYETLVVHPGWKHSSDAKNLQAAMTTSGQLRSGKYFWPFVSPLTALLAVANIVLAWSNHSDASSLWLAAAIVMLLDRLFTFTYFVPTLAKLQHPEAVAPAKLGPMVKRWTTLSSLRTLTGMLAWILGAWAIFRLV